MSAFRWAGLKINVMVSFDLVYYHWISSLNDIHVKLNKIIAAFTAQVHLRSHLQHCSRVLRSG